ncbi:hypothetical protein EDB89DRAFT_1912601 [Lactarius sanguifluus]|nr:hypothetical protein EDB89DRAFT_1912601 [Lactarius sanguifluus]
MLTCSPSPSLQHFYNAPPAQMRRRPEIAEGEGGHAVRDECPCRRQGSQARANPLARSHIAIAVALCDPTIFDFDQLFELNVVLIAQIHPLFVLWTFSSSRLDALHAWQKAHTDTAGSVHDRDLNRAAGSSTVSRISGPQDEAVTMAVEPAPKLSGGTADAHKFQSLTRLCTSADPTSRSTLLSTKGPSNQYSQRLSEPGIGMADRMRAEASALLLINPPWVKTKVETPHSDLHTLFEFILFFATRLYRIIGQYRDEMREDVVSIW